MSPTELATLLEKYETLAQRAHGLCFMSCKAIMQAKCAEEILTFMKGECANARKNLITEGNEDIFAKLIVAEAHLSALFHELGALVCLKGEAAEDAWDHFVKAENAIAVVGKLTGDASAQFERLRLLEQIFFPKQSFLSAGIVIKASSCSICSCDLDDCEHVVGRIYEGEFCTRIISEVDIKEVSVLTKEEPYDRRCRVTHISEAGAKTNLLTRESEPCERTDQVVISGYSLKY